MDIPKLFSFASGPGAMINPQWLELPQQRKQFHSSKDVHVIEVWLYTMVVVFSDWHTRN